MRPMLTLVATALALTGCTKPKVLYVDGGWVRLSAVRDNPSAAYFKVHGGPADATLINVSTDVAIKSQMHETMTAGTTASMKPVTAVAIPAHATVAFAPGGRHVMLFDVNPGIKPGATITFTYSFGNGMRIQQNAIVVAAGDPPPKGA